jgi:hypothetical protein
MPTTIIETLADQAAELDELAESKLQEYGERVRALIADPMARDRDVWDLYGGDLNLGIADFALVPRAQRDSEWLERFASMILSAEMQAFAEIVARDLLTIADRHGELSDRQASKMSQDALRAAAKLGISKDAVSEATRNRQAARAATLEASAAKELL